MVLQGPCDFQLQSQMIGFLKSGKITANVPHRAFYLHHSFAAGEFHRQARHSASPSAVAARQSTAAKCCAAFRKDTSEHSEPIHLTTKALAFDSKSDAPSDIAIDKAQFRLLIKL